MKVTWVEIIAAKTLLYLQQKCNLRLRAVFILEYNYMISHLM